MMQISVVAAEYERLSYGKAINAIQALSARGNLFLQERQPWTAFKKVVACSAFTFAALMQVLQPCCTLYSRCFHRERCQIC